ncbi:Crp/Fnr family transcriptional regulator [Desulfomarina sp.]
MKTKLSSINLLEELTKPENKEFSAEFTDVSYAENNLVFSPGHENNLVFIVKKGRLRLYLAVEDKDFSLAILEPGDIYVTHTRAHVQTLEPSVLMIMPTRRLHRYMTTYPALSKTIISILGEMLKQSFSIIDSLVFKDIKQRIVDFFIHEAEKNGTVEADGVVVRIELTTAQLAAIVGASRQTVSTLVNAMLKDGLLVKTGKSVYRIPDITFLYRSASL